MKKALYIQPVVKTQKIETEMVMAGSNLNVNDNQPTEDNLSNNFAKKAIIWE